jgi:hypothetical protein
MIISGTAPKKFRARTWALIQDGKSWEKLAQAKV